MRYRTKAKLEGGELEISGDQWLIFLYEDYHCDVSNPWNGIFHSKLLVNVSIICFVTPANHQFQVYKHIFTSPSSVTWGKRASAWHTRVLQAIILILT